MDIKVKKSEEQSAKDITKGERTRIRILEGAIRCIAIQGIEDLTFQAIADECGISQPLVVHYFKKKDQVFPEVIRHLVERSKSRVFIQGTCAAEDIEKYVRSAFAVLEEGSAFAKVYLTLSYRAVFNHHSQSQNNAIKQANIQRIKGILEAGVREGSMSPFLLAERARTINSLLAGVFLDLMTDNIKATDEIIETTVSAARHLAKG